MHFDHILSEIYAVPISIVVYAPLYLKIDDASVIGVQFIQSIRWNAIQMICALCSLET